MSSTGCQASLEVVVRIPSSICTTRSSVGVKSALDLGVETTTAAKEAVHNAEHQQGSGTNSDLPRNGETLVIFRLVGTNRLCTNSENLSICTPDTGCQRCAATC